MTTYVKVQDTNSKSKIKFNCEVYEIDYYNIKCLLDPFYGPIIDACNDGRKMKLQLDFENEENKYIAARVTRLIKISEQNFRVIIWSTSSQRFLIPATIF